MPPSAASSVRPELIWPGMPLPDEQQGPIRHACWSVAGKLPGGVAGRLRHQAVYGKTFGMNVAMQHTIMVCRIPESVGYLPMLSVRAEGLEPALFYWANDRRPREDVGGFESMELDRRYIVEVAKGQDHAWLRQLFPPSFIDWLASNTPVDFGFRLDNGVFTCECPQYRGQHRADGEVDESTSTCSPTRAGGRAAGSATRCSKRRTSSWGGTNPDSAAAHEARASQPLGGRVMRMITKFAEGIDTSVKDFGEKHGMEPRPPPSSTPTTSACRCPAPRPTSFRDPCPAPTAKASSPGSSSRAWSTWRRTTSRSWSTRASDLPSAWLDAEDVTIPGFGEGLSERALELARAGTLRGVDRRARRPASTSRARLSRQLAKQAKRSKRSCPRALELVDALA